MRLLLCTLVTLLLGVSSSSARYNIVPKLYAQDSAIIVDTDQPPPSPFSPSQVQQKFLNAKSSRIPYYQPIQSIPAYKIISRMSAQNAGKPTPTTPAATIFTQEEFPRDLLEIAQKKLGLKTLDEVPSVTELAELLGTNSAAETISYIRQLTSTDQGIALMKAYIESSDYTDNVRNNKDNEVIENEVEDTTPSKIVEPIPATTENATKPGFLQRIAAFLNIYDMQPQPTRIPEQNRFHTNLEEASSTSLRNHHRPLYVRSPLPYHYPVPLRPAVLNRTNFNMYGPPVASPSNNLSRLPNRPHMNTMRTLTPAHIHHLARLANISPRTLESFLQRKPKLAELAMRVASLPPTHGNGNDAQLFAAVRKAIESDEELKMLLNSTSTLK